MRRPLASNSGEQQDLPSNPLDSGKGHIASMSSWVKFIKRRKVLILTIIMVSFALLHDVPTQMKIRSNKHSRMSKMKRTLRHSNDQCAKSPYINVDQAVQLMPPSIPDGSVPNDVPSHVTLCQELINRNNAAKVYDEKQKNGEIPPVFTKLVVHESRDLCKDWARPHSALMEIISSSIIAYVGKRFGLKYEHRCHATIDPKSVSDSIPFDITDVQQIFPEATMPINERKIKLGDVVHTLCHACIEQYNNGGYDYSIQKTHHCLAFPYIQNVHEGTIRAQQFDPNDPNAMPQIVMQQDVLDGEGHLVRPALASVMPLVKKRLYHAALDWSNRSQIPAHDPKSGVVIFLDANLSLAVPFWLFQQHISTTATHISILSGPMCAQGHLLASDIAMQMKGGISCVKYALGKQSILVSSSINCILHPSHLSLVRYNIL